MKILFGISAKVCGFCLSTECRNMYTCTYPFYLARQFTGVIFQNSNCFCFNNLSMVILYYGLKGIFQS